MYVKYTHTHTRQSTHTGHCKTSILLSPLRIKNNNKRITFVYL